MLKLKSLTSQLCGIFPYICLQFTYAAILGFQTILIAELHKNDSEIPTSLDQLSWFASLDIFKVVGSLFTGLLMHRFGSRSVALLEALMFTTTLLLYHYSTSATNLFISRLLCSMLAVHSLAGPHISEVSEPRFRGPFFAFAQLIFTCGLFFSFLLGSLVYWRTIALVNIIFPIAAALTVFLVPNSPVWLANNGHLEEAEKALCWLRGWVKPNQVQPEFRDLLDHLQKKTSTSDKEKMDIETKEVSRPFLQQSFYVPLGTMCIIFLVHSFSGMDTMETYATVTFRELHSPIEESQATAIMGAMGIVGNLVVLLLVHRVGKRKLIFFSVIMTALCQAIVAGIGFSELQGKYLWIPAIALIVAKFADYAGIGSFVYVLPSEIFPSGVRYIGTSITISLKMIMKSIMNKSFLYAVDAVSISGVFLFFTIVNLIALLTYYFLFPETEGRSLKEIEDHFNGDKNMKKTRK